MDTLSPRELWIQALRSGKYKQCKYALNFEGGYCCLGVACEVYQQQVGDLVVEKFDKFSTYDNHDIFLPEKVRKWLKLETVNGEDKYSSNVLSILNDTGSTFEEIANILEKDDGYFES